MSNIITSKGVPIQVWTNPDEIETQALEQLKNTAALPWVFHHVAVMPDVHYGKGATVGSVVATQRALSPATVGVDIGCGMGAIKTSLKASDLPDNLEGLRSSIEARIPVGFNSHPVGVQPPAIPMAYELYGSFGNLHSKVQNLLSKSTHQLGTLGGGNHFIEICLDDGVCAGCRGRGTDGCEQGCPCKRCDGFPKSEASVWLMLHSGSRNIGKELAEIHIGIAKSLIHNADLPDKDLAVFLSGTPEMAAYRHDLVWAQNYAMLNRVVMFELLKKVVLEQFPAVTFDKPILCHHNYVSEETHFGENVLVTRKGAISARAGELGIIPGSMGTKSYIVRGLGNKDSYHSASHGAGRRMSRGKAKRSFTLEDFAKQTEGVCCRKDAGVLDEIPGAYKDIDKVMGSQNDLVEVVATLKQVMCIKG